MENKQQNLSNEIEKLLKVQVEQTSPSSLSVEIGCHLEETCEMLESLGLSYITAYKELKMVSESFKDKLPDCLSVTDKLLANDNMRIDFLAASLSSIASAISCMSLANKKD